MKSYDPIKKRKGYREVKEPTYLELSIEKKYISQDAENQLLAAGFEVVGVGGGTVEYEYDMEKAPSLPFIKENTLSNIQNYVKGVFGNKIYKKVYWVNL